MEDEFKEYTVTYLDSKEGTSVMTWNGLATDSGHAIDLAHEDYYFGKFLDVECNQ